jgi:hypothetical protein
MEGINKKNIIDKQKPTTTPLLAGTAQAEPPREAPNQGVRPAEDSLKPERTPDARVPKGTPAKVTDPETMQNSTAGTSQIKHTTAESGTTPVEPSKQVIDPGWEIRCKPRGKKPPQLEKPTQGVHTKEKVSQRKRQRLMRQAERRASMATNKVEAPPITPTVVATTSKEQTKAEENKISKRARLDETISPRGEHKKIKIDSLGKKQTHPTYAAAAATDLTVAITNERTGRLSQQDAEEVEKKIGDAIFQAAIETDLDTIAEAPAFSGRPSVVDGYLKLWCQDANTKQWLMTWLATATLTNGDRLVGKREDEMVRKTRCGILIPSIEDNLTKVGRVLNFQNSWAEVRKWTIHQAIPLRTRGCTLMLVGIPESVVPAVLERNRKLNYLCGSVYIRFQHSGGHFKDSPPDTNTTPEEDNTQSEVSKAIDSPAKMETDGADNEPDSDMEEGVLLESEDEEGCTKGISLLDLRGRKEEGTSTDGSFAV